MTEAEQKIGDYINDCVNKGSFTISDMEQVLDLFKKAGYIPLADIKAIYKNANDLRDLEMRLAEDWRRKMNKTERNIIYDCVLSFFAGLLVAFILMIIILN